MLTRRAILAGSLASAATGVAAHEKWWNGKEVDAATKRLCCGDNDVHHLTREQVRITPDGYLILATGELIPHSRVQPSPDGEIWAFVWGSPPETQCFFAPIGAM